MGAAQAQTRIIAGFGFAVRARPALIFTIDLRQALEIRWIHHGDTRGRQPRAAGFAIAATVVLRVGEASARATGCGIWQQAAFLQILLRQGQNMRQADRPGHTSGVIGVSCQ